MLAAIRRASSFVSISVQNCTDDAAAQAYAKSGKYGYSARMTADFPAPWTVVEATGEFSVQDATGRTLCHFYWWGDAAAVQLTQLEARRLAEQFAKMPDSLSEYNFAGTTAARAISRAIIRLTKPSPKAGPSTDFVPILLPRP
jgi:hypothetical protein